MKFEILSNKFIFEVHTLANLRFDVYSICFRILSLTVIFTVYYRCKRNTFKNCDKFSKNFEVEVTAKNCFHLEKIWKFDFIFENDQIWHISHYLFYKLSKLSILDTVLALLIRSCSQLIAAKMKEKNFFPYNSRFWIVGAPFQNEHQ